MYLSLSLFLSLSLSLSLYIYIYISIYIYIYIYIIYIYIYIYMGEKKPPPPPSATWTTYGAGRRPKIFRMDYSLALMVYLDESYRLPPCLRGGRFFFTFFHVFTYFWLVFWGHTYMTINGLSRLPEVSLRPPWTRIPSKCFTYII